MKTLTITIIALTAILGLAIYAAVEVWAALADTAISVHGWIAMGIGTVATLAIGAGLMFLVFYSNRRGYDDPDQQQN